MNFIKQRATALTLAASVLLGACGGGGGGIGGTGSPVAVSYGGVTALGSVWVNGVEFSTSNATVRDRSGASVEVKAGMVVQVDGSIADRRADTVTVEGSLQGFVEQVIDANQIVVMGQTVRIDDTSCGDGAPKPQRPTCGEVLPMARGDRVEVHGLMVADGVVAGGYISKRSTAPTPAFAVKGIVSNAAGNSFSIGALTVNFAAPANGQLVEVKGSACTGTPPICGTLTATSVQTSGLRVTERAQAEVEGYVAPGSLVGGSFTVGTQPVLTTGSTVFIGGALADVLPGSKLEIEGSISGGVLNATKLRFLDSIRIEASVATRVGNALTFDGLPGVTVNTNALTELSNLISVNALAPGQFVRLRGRPAAGNSVVATRLELRTGGGNNRTLLQATVGTVAPPHLSLLGVDVDTTALADAAFRGTNDTPSSRAAFFAAVKAGSLVKARGTLSGSSLALDEIEFED